MRKLYILTVLFCIFSRSLLAQCTSQVIASYFPGLVCSGKSMQFFATTIPGATYTWGGPNFYSTSQNPIVANTSTILSGDFVVTATVGSCVYKDTVNVAVGVTPGLPQIATSAPPCSGSNLFFTIIGTGGQQISYTLFNPSGTPIPNAVFNLNTSNNGIYKAVGTHISGCISDTGTYNLHVITLNKPQITGNHPICKGDSLNLGVINNNPAPDNYYWNINGSPQYTPPMPLSLPVVNTGGFATLQVVKNSCFSPADTAYLILKPGVAPETKLSMSGQINPNGSTITLTANVTNGGANPGFQWYRNNIQIPGAINSTYTGFINTDMMHNDRFYVAVTRETDTVCGGTANSDTIQLNLNLGIDEINTKDVSIYPNPNNGLFEITLPTLLSKATITITDVAGREVWRTRTMGSQTVQINTGSTLCPGLYLLRAYNGQRVYQARFAIYR